MADEPSDDDKLAEYGRALAQAVDATLPGWVERCVATILEAFAGSVTEDQRAAATAAGAAALADVAPRLRTLLAADIDDHRTNPLSILRGAVKYPTAVLREAGVPDVVREEFDEAAFPDDVYGLVPASFADIDPSLANAGLAWGAAKAHVHLRRRRPAPPPVVAYAPDLADASKVKARFPGARMVRRPDALLDTAIELDADLVVVDLSRPGVIDILEALTEDRLVVGFASHVDEATIERANAAGCEALARSVFFRRLAAGEDLA